MKPLVVRNVDFYNLSLCESMDHMSQCMRSALDIRVNEIFINIQSNFANRIESNWSSLMVSRQRNGTTWFLSEKVSTETKRLKEGLH